MRGIEALIRECGPREAHDPACQQIVVIDTSTGQPAGGGLMQEVVSGVFGWKKYLLVSDERHPDGVWVRKGLVFSLTDIGRGRTVELKIDYTVRCPKDSATRLAIALHAVDDAAVALDRAVKRWVQEWITWRGGEAAFIDLFFADVAGLREHIARRASEDLGLGVDAALVLDDGSAPAPVELQRRSLSVRLCDQDEERPFQERPLVVDARTEPFSGSARTVLPLPGAEVEAKITATIAEHFARQVTTAAYFDALGTSVSPALQRHLEATLAAVGWRLTSFRIEGSPSSTAVDPLEVDVDFTVTVADNGRPVRVTGQVILRRTSVAAHERAGAPDMAAWVKGELARITRQTFSTRTLADLCDRFDGLRAALKIELGKEAAKRGYSIEQLTLDSDLRADRPFAIEAQVADVPTKRPGVKVGLSIVLAGQFKSRSKLARILGRDADVDQALHAEVAATVRRAMSEVEPEDYYLHFDKARDARHVSVREQLREAVQVWLGAELGAQLVQNTCNRLDTDITDWLRELMRPAYDVEIVVAPASGHEPITYHGVFDVKGPRLDEWETCIQRRPDAATLVGAVAEHLRARLARIDVQWLMFTAPEEMLGTINQILSQHVGERFGLTVKMASWRRDLTQAEQEDIRVRVEHSMQAGRVRIDVLQRQASAAVAAFASAHDALMHRRTALKALRDAYVTEVIADPDRAIEIKRQIEALEKELGELETTTPRLPFDPMAAPPALLPAEPLPPPTATRPPPEPPPPPGPPPPTAPPPPPKPWYLR